MIGNSRDTILLFHTCKRNMANDFIAFYYNKILNIRSELGLICHYETILIPESLKTALIRPLLKKTGLDSDILKNYRPRIKFNIYLESH